VERGTIQWVLKSGKQRGRRELGATGKYKTRLRKANILLEVLVHGLEGDTLGLREEEPHGESVGEATDGEDEVVSPPCLARDNVKSAWRKRTKEDRAWKRQAYQCCGRR
jgi:hypothetical protein